MTRKTSQERIEKAILRYEDGALYDEIAVVLGVHPKNVGRTLRNAGYEPTRRRLPPHPVNEHFFDDWTRESAYVLGFFYADGSLEPYYTARFYSSDKELLEMIRDVMDMEREIEGPYKHNYRLSVSSRRICKRLRELGLAQKKTGTMVYPDVPIEVERDFIRGFFDGDGHVGKKPSRGAPIVNFTNTSLAFIKGLVKALERHDINHQPIALVEPRTDAHSKQYIVEFRNWTLFHRFARLLYGHRPTLFLERKRERFFKHSNPQPSPRTPEK